MENIEKYLHNIQKDKEQKICSSSCVEYKINLLGDVISLNFQNIKIAEPVIKTLSGLLTETNQDASSRFYFWEGNCNKAVTTESEFDFGRYNFSGKTGEIFLFTDNFLVAFSALANEYYFVITDQIGWYNGDISESLLEISFAHWFRNKNMYAFHAGCFGINGKGALITGRSGAGKSTLSVSCLMDLNFDFITDEYVVLEKHDKDITAHSCFKTISLHQDSAKKLNINYPLIRVNRINQDKLTFHPDSSLFSEKLKIQYLIIPSISNLSSPVIEKVPIDKAIVPLVHSSLQLMHRYHDKKLVVKYIELIKDLPCYQINLSNDIELNKECIKKFFM